MLLNDMEGWSFGGGLYFAFIITLSTIDFRDYVVCEKESTILVGTQ